MVARVKSGKSIRGVLNYNENKVKEGTARCIDAAGFGCQPEELSFKNNVNRFTDLTARNKIAKTNAIHITLNFHPEEKLSEQTLKEIAATYLEKIGFGDQPYLVYQHQDAAHPHIHIATVNIRSDGKRIDIHDIGRNESEKARTEIEEDFGLVKAGEQEHNVATGLKPADLSVAQYGKRPTKNEISNIVRTVAKYYRYTNFEEFSNILREYNILANRGEPGTKMYQAGGLVYQLLDPKTGQGAGIPIKSSSIYEKPTLKNIDARYEKNREIRKNYRERTRQTIDYVLATATDKQSFLSGLKKENIIATFKENKEGYIYGVTYIDKTACCFFNGSDLGKLYSAKAIQERLQTGTPEQNALNRDFVGKLLAETDFSKDFKEVLFSWMRSGALVKAIAGEEGDVIYILGRIQTEPESYLAAGTKMSAYLRANRFGPLQAATIFDFLAAHIFSPQIFHKNGNDWQKIFSTFEKELYSVIQKLWEPVYSSNPLPYELLRESRKKKRKKRN